MIDVVKAKPILHIVGGTELLFHPYVCWSRVAMFAGFDLALPKVHVLASIAQHLLSVLGGNLAMCHFEARHPISNTNVV